MLHKSFKAKISVIIYVNSHLQNLYPNYLLINKQKYYSTNLKLSPFGNVILITNYQREYRLSYYY